MSLKLFFKALPFQHIHFLVRKLHQIIQHCLVRIDGDGQVCRMLSQWLGRYLRPKMVRFCNQTDEIHRD